MEPQDSEPGVVGFFQVICGRLVAVDEVWVENVELVALLAHPKVFKTKGHSAR